MTPTGPHLPRGVKEGEIILRKYRIGALLGWGSMGTVVAAHHLHLDKRIAIKFLRPEAVEDPESRERFFREGRAADRIRSKHAVRVFDVGTLSDGAPYIVMEYLEGSDLAAWLRRRGRATAPQAIDFVLQACDAIGDAHQLGIVHRDIKPANLFVVEYPTAGPSIRVLDFGIAKTTGLLSSTLPPSECLAAVVTEEKALMGTPFYMSPEQLNSSRAVDARSDVWSLGVVLFQLLTGHLPFEGTIVDLCVKIMTPLRPRESFPDISERIETIILKCLERDPDRRYANAKDLAAALAPFGSVHPMEAADGTGEEVVARSARHSDVPSSPEVIRSEPPPPTTRRAARRIIATILPAVRAWAVPLAALASSIVAIALSQQRSNGVPLAERVVIGSSAQRASADSPGEAANVVFIGRASDVPTQEADEHSMARTSGPSTHSLMPGARLPPPWDSRLAPAPPSGRVSPEPGDASASKPKDDGEWPPGTRK